MRQKHPTDLDRFELAISACFVLVLLCNWS